MRGVAAPLRVALLTDSRGFDTYYLNSAYGSTRYGYDKTFPHLLRAAMLMRGDAGVDIVHIPDHFRSSSVETNIDRLALTRPSMVVLLDGIWETLLGKQHFLDYAERACDAHPLRLGAPLKLEFSTATLASLYLADRLAMGPSAYCRQQQRIISYFRRRGCAVVWLTLPIPPRDHLDGIHYAGFYETIPEWGDCLAAVNQALVPMVESWGGHVLDLDALMGTLGGAGACLIDQWHFSPLFHAAIAETLGSMIDAELGERSEDSPSAALDLMAGCVPDELQIVLCGSKAGRAAWRRGNPEATVLGEIDAGARPACDAQAVVVLEQADDLREAQARRMLAACTNRQAVLFPEELISTAAPPPDIGQEPPGRAPR